MWGGVIEEDSSSSGRLQDDGAVLSLADGRWTPMPPSPFVEGLYGAIGAWDGEEVIVIGTECEADVPPATDGTPPACPRGPAAAAFDPASFTWRRLEAPPIPPHEYHGTPVLDRGTAIGRGGQALFTFGWRATSITWDRTTEVWGTVPSPDAEVDWADTCTDPVAGQVVAMAHQQPFRSEAAPLQVLAIGDDGWSAPVVVDAAVEGISCGDGRVTSSWYDGFGDEGRSTGWVFDLETEALEAAFEPTPGLRSSRIVGPWLLIDTLALPADIGGEPRTHPTTVRLAAGGASRDIELPEGFGGTWVPGVGLLGSAWEDGQEHLVLWRAPDDLLPQ